MPYFSNQNNLEIYYEFINEKADLPLIVLIHEYGASLTDFRKQIPFLSKYFKIILFDAENHGKSEKQPFEMQRDLINSTMKDLRDLLDFLKIFEKFSLLGHGLFGCGVVQKFSISFPESIEFNILLNGGTLIFDSTIKNIFWNYIPVSSRRSFQEIFGNSYENLIDQILPFIYSIISPDDVKLSDIEKIILKDRIRKEIWDLIEDALPIDKIQTPTLIIATELDDIAPLYMSKIIQKNIKNSEMYIVNMTGHFGLSQRFQDYNKIIFNFLKKINAIKK